MLFMYKLHGNIGWYVSYLFQGSCRSVTCYSDDKHSTTPCVFHVFYEWELTAWFLNNKGKWQNRSTGSSCWSCFISQAFLRSFQKCSIYTCDKLKTRTENKGLIYILIQIYSMGLVFINAHGFKKWLKNVLKLINKQPISTEIDSQWHYDVNNSRNLRIPVLL